MREFDDHGAPIEPPKKKKFGFFSNYEKDGKGVKKEDIITDYTFLNFFKLYFRRFTKLVWVNALYIMGNFPVFFLLLALSGYFSRVGSTPSSELFPLLNGIRTASGDAVSSISVMLGIHGGMAPVYASTVVTNILYALSALAIFTFGPVNAGCTYIVKNLVKGEPIFMWQDFKATIRTNWKQSMIFGIFDLITIGVCAFSLQQYWYNYERYFILFYALLIVIFLYACMRFYFYTIMVTFDQSLFKIIKNAAIFSLLAFGRNFVAFFGIVFMVMLTISLGSVFVPFAVISIFILLFSTCAFMGMYAAYPKIKKFMIDPYYDENGEPLHEES